MSMISNYRVTILVKASPQPSERHNETVCCAGVTDKGEWKRLFPIRFRQLSDEQSFKRWSIVSFNAQTPTSDTRKESCRVYEESIKIEGLVTKDSEKTSTVSRVLVGSEREAASKGASLALIRPRDVKFRWQKRSSEDVERTRKLFEQKAAQTSMFDKELATFKPSPYKFLMHYSDEAGPHRKECADWETHAAFFKLRSKYGDEGALQHLADTYTKTYAEKGLVFALGNLAKRPQTWQLLGIFPVADSSQASLF